GVDFNQRSVGFHVALIKLLENVYGLIDGLGRQFDLLGNLGGLLFGEASQRVDVLGNDFLGRGGSHFLDIHTAFAGSNESHFLGSAVGHDGNVVFLLDVGALFDIQATHFLAFRAGLVRNKLHAQ